MKIQSSLPSYLDIIFYSRNKAYGGYELRLNYSRRARNGALFTFLAAGLLCSWLMLPGKEEAHKILLSDKPFTFTHIDPNIYKVLPPPPAARLHNTSRASTTQPVNTKIFTQPVIVTSTPDQQVLAPIEELKNAQPGPSSSAGSDLPSAGSATGNGAGTGSGTGIESGIGDSKPFGYAEQMPEFQGSINDYLNANMHYPDAAREMGIAGRVVVKFVVNEDGSISGAEVVRSIGGGCDAEALRVIKNMPRWKPGKQNGRAVKVYYTLPIVFVLQ